MFENLKAEEYQAAFDKAINLLRATSRPCSCTDLHDLAHQALELYFSSYITTDSEPLEDCIQILLEKNACAQGQLALTIDLELSELQNGSDLLAGVETAVDLGRLYLQAAEHLDQDEKRLFFKIWSLEELTDDEAESIDALGQKIRRIIDVHSTTTTQRHFYKSGRQGKAQIYKWQAFYERRLARAAEALKARNRRSRFRFCN